VLSPPDHPRVDSDLFRWFDDETIAALTTESPLVDLAAALLGSDEVVLVEDQWFCSEPGATTPSPWHQDDPYYNLDRPFLTVWITLDDIDLDAALRVVPGSHRGTIYAPVEFSAGEATIGASTLEPVPDVDGDADRFPVHTWELSAGDAVAFDSRLLHATGRGAIEGRPFRRVSTRWATPDTRYLDRGSQAASFWQVLPHGLSTGDPLACEVFPVRHAVSRAG
jgi:ectoine hydroxylase-related dioxygenase (phytanoyl-CoA dioxygenase family)